MERILRELHVKQGTGNVETPLAVYPNLPIWGKLEIYDSQSDAIGALSENEKAKQFVRLIKIADNMQL